MIRNMHEITMSSYEGKSKITVFDIKIINDVPMMQRFTMSKVKDFSRICFTRDLVLNNPGEIILSGEEDYNFSLQFRSLYNEIRGSGIIVPTIISDDQKVLVDDTPLSDNKLIIAELERLKWAIRFIDCNDNERVVMQAFGKNGVNPDIIRSAFAAMMESLRFSSRNHKYSEVKHEYTGMYKEALKRMKG